MFAGLITGPRAHRSAPVGPFGLWAIAPQTRDHNMSIVTLRNLGVTQAEPILVGLNLRRAKGDVLATQRTDAIMKGRALR